MLAETPDAPQTGHVAGAEQDAPPNHLCRLHKAGPLQSADAGRCQAGELRSDLKAIVRLAHGLPYGRALGHLKARELVEQLALAWRQSRRQQDVHLG